MSLFRRYTIALLGSAAAVAWGGGAYAADLLLSPQPIVEQDLMLPAVSGVNGKWELSGGLLSPGGAGLHAAGSLSIPLGDRFGAQADMMAVLDSVGNLYLGGAGHLFTRDPSRYLLGVTAGVVVAPGAKIGAVGIEGELYMDRWSLEGWAGLAAVDYAVSPPADYTGFFGFGDVAYYPTDNLRLAVGASYVLGDGALHLSSEYQFDNMAWPMSLTGDAKIHAGGDYTLTVGLKGYFGGDSGKSLIDRHRQDDPRNRALDLFNGSVGVLNATSGNPPPIDDPEYAACVEDGADSRNYGYPVYDDEDNYIGDWEWNWEGDCDFVPRSRG